MAEPKIPAHLLVQADNAAALPALAAELECLVDLVLIDPPYDHGDGGRRGSQARFTYADRRDDWAGFIRERLELAKPLLAPAACVAVIIGHRRVHELAMLLRETWPERELVTITIDLMRAPADRLGVQRTAEYLLISVPAGVRLGAPGLTRGEARNGWNGMALSSATAARYPNQVYPIHVDETGRITGAGPSVRDDVEAGMLASPADFDYTTAPRTADGLTAIWPITREGKPAVWRIARETFDSHLASGWVRADRPHMPGNVQPFTIKYLTSGTRKRIARGEISTHGLDGRGALILDRGIAPAGDGVPTVWRGSEYETRAGTARLDELLGHDHGFAYPKPVATIADAIRTCTGGAPDALVLDFFAGSGTTADAVLQQNAADDGARRAVLIQNDEGGVFDRVLVPRVHAANTRREPIAIRRQDAAPAEGYPALEALRDADEELLLER